MLSESINGNAKPETIFEERRRALEREWQTVQDLRDEIALLKSELEMGKLPSEPQERRRLYMRRMDALQGKVAALEAEGAVLRQNCKEVSGDRASPAVGVAKRGKTNAAAPLSGQRRRVRNAAARRCPRDRVGGSPLVSDYVPLRPAAGTGSAPRPFRLIPGPCAVARRQARRLREQSELAAAGMAEVPPLAPPTQRVCVCVRARVRAHACHPPARPPAYARAHKVQPRVRARTRAPGVCVCAHGRARARTHTHTQELRREQAARAEAEARLQVRETRRRRGASKRERKGARGREGGRKGARGR